MSLREGLRIGAAAVVLVLLVVGGPTGCKSGGGARVGELAPDFVLPQLDGKVTKLSNYRGQVVLLNLWATWCPPCLAEMPMLNNVAKLYQDRGLAVVGIAGDENRADVERYVRESPLAFDVLLDPQGAVGTEYGITGYPETFLIDREGRVIEKIVGPVPSREDQPLPEFIEALDRALSAGGV